MLRCRSAKGCRASRIDVIPTRYTVVSIPRVVRKCVGVVPFCYMLHMCTRFCRDWKATGVCFLGFKEMPVSDHVTLHVITMQVDTRGVFKQRSPTGP